MKLLKGLIDELLIACKNTYPNEFFAFLSSSNNDDIIDNYVIIPLFYQTRNSVSYRLDLLPIDKTIIGTIHSHPVKDNIPSSADKDSFSKTGQFHLIIGYPYNQNSIKAYDSKGREVSFEQV